MQDISKYEKILEARKILELPEAATMEEIKDSYRRLIKKWHPDRCVEEKEACLEMTNKIISAYKVILNYCRNYKFSFSQKEVEKYITGEEWWMRQFGQGPVWEKYDA